MGSDDNHSWNCGVEGPTADPSIQTLATPPGEEPADDPAVFPGHAHAVRWATRCGGRSSGNNNAYCQDNEVSWFDWGGLREHGAMLRFVQRLLRFRREHGVVPAGPHLVRRRRNRDLRRSPGTAFEPYRPDWGYDSHSLAFSLHDPAGGASLYVALNAYWEPLTFELPSPPTGCNWHRVVDTSLASPNDIAEPGCEPVVDGAPRIPWSRGRRSSC